MLLEMLVRILHMSLQGKLVISNLHLNAPLRSNVVAYSTGLHSFRIYYTELDQEDRYSYHAALDTI